MTTLNISLPENLKAFVEDQVASGGYSTVSEYVRSLIRQAQERKTQEAIESKLLAALSDEPEEMSREDWDRLRARVRQVAAEKKK
ncbi:MAG TPA: type II toxin-antitoxin system ParD family antitoxin [Thermoanaerobaculia bacterium]|jgi:antitoxin ParD1/3/4|nr:type II toxin-antitoxin system ParD family antitoxin [Thermoanaerobaculia bacterium]